MNKNWSLSQEAFDALLDWLDPDREQAGMKYEQIRSRLIKIFTGRGCVDAEELADETINRVTRKLKEIQEEFTGDRACDQGLAAAGGPVQQDAGGRLDSQRTGEIGLLKAVGARNRQIVALFLVQQKMFTPPATDEQTKMQQQMMTIMTVVMGVLFYKVPAGLCIYFITSSLWGITERKLLPKSKPKDARGDGGGGVVAKLPAKPASPNGSSKPAFKQPKQRR